MHIDHQWRLLGRGAYNTCYINRSEDLVLKVMHDAHDETDTPERSVRLWNLINAEVSPKAALFSSPLGAGWICPYIKGRQSTDDEIFHALISIFNRTGRVVIDAAADSNFLSNEEGQCICVDIGMALALTHDEDAQGDGDGVHRTKSRVSLETWADYQIKFISQAQFQGKHFPQTIMLIKSLLFIKAYYPDLSRATFLSANQSLLPLLADAYDNQLSCQFDQQIIRHALLKIGDVCSPSMKYCHEDSEKSALRQLRTDTFSELKEDIIAKIRAVARKSVGNSYFSGLRSFFFGPPLESGALSDWGELVLSQVSLAKDYLALENCLFVAMSKPKVKQYGLKPSQSLALEHCFERCVEERKVDHRLLHALTQQDSVSGTFVTRRESLEG